MLTLTPYSIPSPGGFLPYGFAGLLRASGLLFFSYLGFDSVSTLVRPATLALCWCSVPLWHVLSCCLLHSIKFFLTLHLLLFMSSTGRGICQPQARFALGNFGFSHHRRGCVCGHFTRVDRHGAVESVPGNCSLIRLFRSSCCLNALCVDSHSCFCRHPVMASTSLPISTPSPTRSASTIGAGPPRCALSFMFLTGTDTTLCFCSLF
jgi:hypothetical protein